MSSSTLKKISAALIAAIMLVSASGCAMSGYLRPRETTPPYAYNDDPTQPPVNTETGICTDAPTSAPAYTWSPVYTQEPGATGSPISFPPSQPTNTPTSAPTSTPYSAQPDPTASAPTVQPGPTAQSGPTAQPGPTVQPVPAVNPSDPVLITDLASLASRPKTTNDLTDNYGGTYSFAVTNMQGWGEGAPFYYSYLLDSHYSRFTGTLYVPHGETSDEVAAFLVKGDGHILYTSPPITYSSRPVSIEVDIAGIHELIIEWTTNSRRYSVGGALQCCLASPYLYRASGNETPVDTSGLPVDMFDLTSVAASVYRQDLLIDNHDNYYVQAYYQRHSTGVEYILDSQYSRFRGTLYIPKGSSFSDTRSLSILADGVEVYVSPQMTKTSQPVSIDVDISGCNVLKIDYHESYILYSKTDHICLASPCLYEGRPVESAVTPLSLGYDVEREMNIDWGWDLFAANAAAENSYNRTLAKAAAYLCEGTYKGQSDAERRMRALGFGETRSEYYEANILTNSSPMTLGSAYARVGSENCLIIAVAIRGTMDLGDFLTDLRSGLFNVDGFTEAGQTGMSVVSSYLTEKQRQYGANSAHTVLFITGHSLGAAVAAQIAGGFAEGYVTVQKRFAYTFASPNYETHGQNTNAYTFIHNIINREDAVPNFPLGGTKYGRNHFFFGSGSSMLEQHMMYIYYQGIPSG